MNGGIFSRIKKVACLLFLPALVYRRKLKRKPSSETLDALSANTDVDLSKFGFTNHNASSTKKTNPRVISGLVVSSMARLLTMPGCR
jgi:hypothetical protein